VDAARQRFVTREAARDLCDVARDVATQLVAAVAPFLSQHGARRARRLTVARVLHLYTYTHQGFRVSTNLTEQFCRRFPGDSRSDFKKNPGHVGIASGRDANP